MENFLDIPLLIHFPSKRLDFIRNLVIKRYSRYKNIHTPEPDITIRKNYKLQRSVQ